MDWTHSCLFVFRHHAYNKTSVALFLLLRGSKALQAQVRSQSFMYPSEPSGHPRAHAAATRATDDIESPRRPARRPASRQAFCLGIIISASSYNQCTRPPSAGTPAGKRPHRKGVAQRGHQQDMPAAPQAGRLDRAAKRAASGAASGASQVEPQVGRRQRRILARPPLGRPKSGPIIGTH